MTESITAAADQILAHTVGRAGGAPGVVAMATDRSANFYEGAAGVRELGKLEPMATDSVMLLASCTKALTGVALMQLIEEGLVALDDPAREYVPEIGAIEVLDGFDPQGEPRLHQPASEITLDQLMLHTSGFGYDFFSEALLRFRSLRDIPSILSCTFDSVRDVLLYEPGTRWNYGCGIDWVGKVVEALRGKRLGEVLHERVFAPLAMNDIAFTMTASMRARLATIHQRETDGQLTPQPDIVLPQPPAMDMGGHGLYATVGDYMKFIRMILNDGAGPHGRVLQAQTVARMVCNGLGSLKSGSWTSSIPALANSGDFFPGLSKSWAYTFQINDEAAPTGRPAGQLSWAGLANSFYWIDRHNGIGGMWSSQILPFQDIGSYPGSVDFETVVYRTLNKG
ncbi:MAG: class A beta-lactamase-related serine hydrolase [Proteobacteria bacterium]|nr:MAG: class A beta-lactamase-related serine hydrolase [Pseudomonadota bacterium]